MTKNPDFVVMEVDYFQTDIVDKVQSQIDTLTEKALKIANHLPMQNLILNQTVQAELRWEKTKNWRPYADIKDSEMIEVFVEEVGKIQI